MKKILLLTSLIFITFGCTKPHSTQDKRYIVTSPEIAEIICLIEGPANIVGVTLECDYPPELKQIEKVGNFGNVNMEKVISLDPSIVFTSGLEQELLTSKLNKIKLNVKQFYPGSIKEMLNSIRDIGELLGKQERAFIIADSLQNIIDSISSTQFTYIPSVYLEIYNDPIMSVSDNSFVGELITLAGGKNIFPKLPRDYARVKAEDVIIADPDVIITTCPAESIKLRKGWEVISAVKNNRVYAANDIDPDLIIRAAPRFIKGVKQLQKILHDEK
ncbi:MAG: helical backbone metal receptor [Candidatus Cloacimonetes bacterium]|nr:helical backbone metal receptor [Candidatus Cloacimonadota bacterium]